MTTFPLYDICHKYAKDMTIPLNNQNRQKFIAFVKKTDDTNVINYIYIIIRKFSLDNEVKSLTDVYQHYYEPKIESLESNLKNITYNFDKLPIQLQHMLYKVMDLSVKKE